MGYKNVGRNVWQVGDFHVRVVAGAERLFF